MRPWGTPGDQATTPFLLPLFLLMIPLHRHRLHALLPVPPFILQIWQRGGLLPPVVLFVLR
jgi:hypothetical protein